jgi:glycosyltransferase involved in cell wall biosynthesis
MNIRIYDFSYHEVVSGGDVIVAEFAKCWSVAGHRVTIVTHAEAAGFFRTRGISSKTLSVTGKATNNQRSVLLGSIAHLFDAITTSLTFRDNKVDVLFASSWSLPDIVPALIAKLRHRNAHLVVGCYIFLLPPWKHAYGATLLHRVIFWISYLIGIGLMRLFADTIWTASPIDAAFVTGRYRKNAFPVRGGVDITMAEQARSDDTKKRYDALYIGRFHPQKNILELIDIWQMVVREKPQATLAIAGAGFQREEIEKKISLLKLTKNITVLPPVDTEEKFRLIAGSPLFVSASHYDTGNLALDEALATAIPGITYDLPHLVYPAGVVRVPPFDTVVFARTIIELLDHETKRIKLGTQAREFAQTLAWESQAAKALKSLGRTE